MQPRWLSQKVGDAPLVIFPPAPGDSSTGKIFACCRDNLLYLKGPPAAKHDAVELQLGFDEIHNVWVTDAKDEASPSPPIHAFFPLSQRMTEYSGHHSALLLSGSRILMTEIQESADAVPRSIPMKGSVSRLMYSTTWNCLIVAVHRDDKPTLELIDLETGQNMSQPCSKSKEPANFIGGLGQPGDRIFGLSEWLYVKDGKTFAFILVSTKEGNLIVASVSEQGTPGQERCLQYWTRFRRRFTQPVYSVIGDSDGIVYCVGNTLHRDHLDVEKRALNTISTHNLVSPATSLGLENNNLHALTAMDSLHVINHRAGPDMERIVVLFEDQAARQALHMINIRPGEGADGRPIFMISDHSREIIGLSTPLDQGTDELEVIFKAKLRHPIRRFFRALGRPKWIGSDPDRQFGTLSSGSPDSSIFGMAVNGSLHHFTLLSPALWRPLRLIQNLAARARWDEIEPQQGGTIMGVDGDILEICLKERMLDDLLAADDCFQLYCRYLDELEGGKHTQGLREASEGDWPESQRASYVNLGYRIIAYLVAPAWTLSFPIDG